MFLLLNKQVAVRKLQDNTEFRKEKKNMRKLRPKHKGPDTTHTKDKGFKNKASYTTTPKSCAGLLVSWYALPDVNHCRDKKEMQAKPLKSLSHQKNVSYHYLASERHFCLLV